MKFEINGMLWRIKLVSKRTLLDIYKETIDDDAMFCFGLTLYPQQTIFINEEMQYQTQIRTLKHELTHCFIWNNGLYNAPNFTEEMACDLVASSNNFINDIVEKYIEWRKNNDK